MNLFFPMLFDWNPGPTNSTIRRISAQIVTEDRQKTQTLVVVMARRVDGWMDVVKKEVRSAAVRIKMMPSWCRYFLWTCRAAAGSGCTDKTRVFGEVRTPPHPALSLVCLHLHLRLHLNNHLLHASQLQGMREKKWYQAHTNKKALQPNSSRSCWIKRIWNRYSHYGHASKLHDEPLEWRRKARCIVGFNFDRFQWQGINLEDL